MATYTVKVLNKTVVSMKTSAHVKEPCISIPFVVVELGLSDSVILPKNKFTMAKAKAVVLQKIKTHLAKLAEHVEYKVTM